MRRRGLSLKYRHNQSRRACFMAAVGIIIEWYDFAIYAHLAPIFTKVFFIEKNSWLALVWVYSIFFLSYLVRPIGSLIYGYIGDNFGRRVALLLSISMISISMLTIAFLPTRQMISIVAPLLLLLFRIIQGISIGGETAGALVYVLESVDIKNRGLYGSVIWSMVVVGVLLGSTTMMCLVSLLSKNELYTWGWRIPYFLGIGLSFMVFILRVYMPESIEFSQTKVHQVVDVVSHKISSLSEIYHYHKLTIFLIVCLAALPAASMAFILFYLPKSMHQYITLSELFWSNTVILLVLLFSMIFFGFLSDRFGKKRLAILSATLFLLLSYPITSMAVNAGWMSIFIAQLLLTIMIAIYKAPFPAIISELSPVNVRYTTVAFGYNIGFALFAGGTPLFSTLLAHKMHNYSATILYLMITAMLSLVGLGVLCYRKRTSVNLAIA